MRTGRHSNDWVRIRVMESVAVFPEQTLSQLKAVWQRWAQWPQLSPGLATRWSKWVRSRRKSRTGKRGAGLVWSQSKPANIRWRGKQPAPPEQTRHELLRLLPVSFCQLLSSFISVKVDLGSGLKHTPRKFFDLCFFYSLVVLFIYSSSKRRTMESYDVYNNHYKGHCITYQNIKKQNKMGSFQKSFSPMFCSYFRVMWQLGYCFVIDRRLISCLTCNCKNTYRLK